MKFLFPLAAALLLSACNNHSSETPQTDDSTSEVKSSACVVSDNTVSPDVYKFWLQTFRDFNSSTAESGPALDNLVDSLRVSADILSQLNEKCEDCENIRVYFAAEHTDENVYVQNLLLVNVADNCNDTAFGDNGMLRLHPGGIEFISSDDAIALYENWGSYLEAAQQHLPSLFAARAYTFSWSVFNQAFGEEDGQMDIHYGMHSLMPSDTAEYGPTLIPQGGSTDEGWMVFNLVVSTANAYTASTNALDFAAPCPKYCGNKKFYTLE